MAVDLRHPDLVVSQAGREASVRAAATVISLSLLLSASGCLVPGYTVVDPADRIETAPPDQALVIFLFASKFHDPPANLFLSDRYIGTCARIPT
jgi:hypothetical protein